MPWPLWVNVLWCLAIFAFIVLAVLDAAYYGWSDGKRRRK